MNRSTRRVLGGVAVLALSIGSFLSGEYVDRRAERSRLEEQSEVALGREAKEWGKAYNSGFADGYLTALNGDEKGRQEYERREATVRMRNEHSTGYGTRGSDITTVCPPVGK